MIVLDFETRSRADLPTVGTYNYVQHPSTEIVCMAAYDMDTDYKELWYPAKGPLSDTLVYELENTDLVAAHYAEFDQGIYECIGVPDHGFPEIPRERWYCSSAQCRVNALPAGLDDAALALGLTQRKDHRGKALIRQLSIPQKDGSFNEDPVLHAEFREYCMQDVITTVAVIHASRPMPQKEHADWLKTCEINERGIRVDLELADLSLKYADAEQSEISKALTRLTQGEIDKATQSQRIKKWIERKLGVLHPVMQQMTIYKNGVPKFSLDKSIRRTILEMAKELVIPVPDDVLAVIQALDDGSMSSVAKFKRMTAMADPEDSRVKGAFVFAGASQTLRYASRGVQVHNMKRDCWSAEDTEELKKAMRLGGGIAKPGETVMAVLAKALRPAIIPAPGKVFIVGDWSAIEGMTLPLLSNSTGGQKKLDRFKSGEDVYISTALDMGFTAAERQIGKVAELALGFSGGVGAFQSMAKNYNLLITDEEAQDNVNRWRAANSWAMDFARDLHTAVSNAMNEPNEWQSAGLVEYLFKPDFIEGTLFCKMPGDHFIQYPKIRWEMQETPYGTKPGLAVMKAAFKPKADAKEWPSVKLWPGMLAENVAQSFAAALLRNAVRELPDVIAHVHDEIIMEVWEKDADQAAGVLRSVMQNVPDWAEGLPLKAEPDVMTRYGKA